MSSMLLNLTVLKEFSLRFPCWSEQHVIKFEFDKKNPYVNCSLFDGFATVQKKVT